VPGEKEDAQGLTSEAMTPCTTPAARPDNAKAIATNIATFISPSDSRNYVSESGYWFFGFSLFGNLRISGGVEPI
jgi:hypothetical protein